MPRMSACSAAQDAFDVTPDVEAEIDELMSGPAAVALKGPKGVGKTATAERWAQTVYRLHDDAQRQLVSASAQGGAAGNVSCSLRRMAAPAKGVGRRAASRR